MVSSGFHRKRTRMPGIRRVRRVSRSSRMLLSTYCTWLSRFPCPRAGAMSGSGAEYLRIAQGLGHYLAWATQLLLIHTPLCGCLMMRQCLVGALDQDSSAASRSQHESMHPVK